MVGTNTPLAANPSLFKKLTYDPVEGLRAGRAPRHHLLHDHGAARISRRRTSRSFLRTPKPTRESCPPATAPRGSQVSQAMLRSMGKIDFIDVPYKGLPQAITDVLGGSVSFTFADLANALAQIKGGKLRGIAVTSQKRSALAPDVPAIAEELPGYELIAWFALVAPAGTPAAGDLAPARHHGEGPRQARSESALRRARHRRRSDEPGRSSPRSSAPRSTSGRRWPRQRESSLNERSAARRPRPRPHHGGDGAVRDPDPRRLRRRRDQGRAARRRRDPPGLAVPQPGHGRDLPQRQPQQALGRARPEAAGGTRGVPGAGEEEPMCWSTTSGRRPWHA